MKKLLFLFSVIFILTSVTFAIDKDEISPEYKALWNDNVNRQIDQRIEKYRKADAKVILENVQKGSRVKVEQLTHSFLFGAHLFNFDQLGSDDLNKKYKALYGENALFNSATVGFYWQAFETEKGQIRFKSEKKDSAEFWNGLKEPWKQPHWRRPAPEHIMDFCEKKGIQMHGHPIIYLRVTPDWLNVHKNNLPELERAFARHIHDITSLAGNRIGSWDVVNESVDPVPGKSRYGYPLGDYTYKSYKQAAAEFDKSVKLNINDSWRDVYPPFIKSLIDRGAKIDVIGLQMHIFDTPNMLKVAAGKSALPNGTSWKPADVEGYLKELDQFKRPVHLSEITIPAPGTDAKANAIQARVTRDMYRLWFSWPSIYRITWWNVVDGCGYKGEPTMSGLFTRQMEPKPVYFVLNDLINKEWKTNLTLTAESDQIKFRGFRGKYRITWTDINNKKQSKEITVE
ncbi:MAG: endo-1,4-beta-xylanase [Planctomycetia bacterium]|nr:endo-1,4-beta-xylanase [Planctomycetia bacterium]